MPGTWSIILPVYMLARHKQMGDKDYVFASNAETRPNKQIIDLTKSECICFRNVSNKHD